MIDHGRPIRNRASRSSHIELAEFLKLFDFAIPKAEYHDNTHSNCQSKNWKESQAGEPMSVSIAPGVVLGKCNRISIEFLFCFSETSIQIMTHCIETTPCSFFMRLSS